MNLTWESLANHATFSQTQLGTALANSTALTDISPGGNVSGQAFQFNADQLQAGQQYRIRAKGIVSNTATPTLLLGIYYGGIAGTALATTGAVNTSSGLSNSIWTLEADMRVETVGTSGSVRTLGSTSGPFAAVTMLPASSSSGNLVTVNTSTTNLLTIGAQWGAASASNTIQVVFFGVERQNEGSS